MRRFLLATAALPLLLLSACSAYHPFKDGEGYADLPMGVNQFQVTFAGTSDMSVTQARQYCLTHAAEVAVLHNMPYFHIDKESVYLPVGAMYWPGSDGGISRRRGEDRGYGYSPGYVEPYTTPEINMNITLLPVVTDGAIPAAYLINQALTQKIPVDAAAVERAKAMPSAPVAIPAMPQPTTKPAG